MKELVFFVYRRGRSQPMTNFSDAAYINSLRKQYWISTAGFLQFCCINGNPVGLYEGMTHRPLYILLYNFISTFSQPSSGSASSNPDVNYNIYTSKCLNVFAFVYYQKSQASINIFTEIFLHSDLQTNMHYTLQAITPISSHTLLLITSLQ
jgi:hypothetical protein